MDDLHFFPSLKKIRLYSVNSGLIWENNYEIDIQFSEHIERVARSLKGDFNFRLSEIDGHVYLHLFIPIIAEGSVIGTMELVDDDAGFLEITKTNQQLITRNMVIGGFSSYFLLFFLFLNIYLKQNANLKRAEESQDLTILSMSLLAELRDNDTGAHIIRTRKYCSILAKQLHTDKRYKNYISADYITDLEKAAPLHDIGKVGIPDNILLKPGKLTDAEFEIIKQHSILGAKVLQNAVSTVSFESYFDIAIQMIKYHHENWDGSGYPEGLVAEAIPLSARIMMIADVYDALTTERVYKKALPHDEAVEIIRKDSGIKFDPALVDNFLHIEDEFRKISQQHR